jgi:glycerol-3-phosphate cytidylyltransferase
LIIGYAYVVADLFHIGHLKHLRACKALCDKLIVGVLTDEATMEKKQPPIIPFKERIEIIRALECVDEAVEQKTYSPLENAVNYNADILFESTSHDVLAIKEAEQLMSEVNGKVFVMPYYEGQSSTAIKEKVVNKWKKKQ